MPKAAQTRREFLRRSGALPEVATRANDAPAHLVRLAFQLDNPARLYPF